MAYDLGTIGAGVRLDNRPFLKSVNQIQTRTASVLTSMQGTFVRIFGTLGVIKLFKDSAEASLDFGEALSNIASIADEVDINRVRTEITGLNSVLGKSTDLAESFYRAYSAGARGSAEELANFTGEAAKLSKAIRADQVPTMKAVTKLMNSYGLTVADAAEISDTLFQIVKQGDTTGQEIATTIGLVANSASIANVSLNEMGAALAVLTRTMETSRAVVSLNQVITSFLDPTKEAKEVAADLGIELSATAIKNKGFAASLQEINEKAGDNVEALALMFGNIRAFRAVATLAGTQSETFQNILGEFSKKGGSALKAFEVQTDNLKTTWTTSMVDMNKALISFGDALAPMIKDLSIIITEVSDVVREMEDWEIQLGLSTIAAGLIIGKIRQFTIATGQAGIAVAATSAQMAGATTIQHAYMNSITTPKINRFSSAITRMGGTMGILQGAILAVPVAMASWKFGRWIADIAGIDTALTELYGNAIFGAKELRTAGSDLDKQINAGAIIRLENQLKKLGETGSVSAEKMALLSDELSRAGDIGGESLRDLSRKIRELLPKEIKPETEIPLTDLLSFKKDDKGLENTLKAFTDEQADLFRNYAEVVFGEGNVGAIAGSNEDIRKLIQTIPELSKVLASEQARVDFKKQLDLIENDLLSFQLKQQQIFSRRATGETTEEEFQKETFA